MRIDDWPLNKIMQLPDECFGQRYLVACDHRATGLGPYWDISELEFPDQGVLWSVSIFWSYFTSITGYIRLALGFVIPTSAAQMTTLEPLLPGVGIQGPDPRSMYAFTYAGQESILVRKLYNFQRRRLILEVLGQADTNTTVRVICTVSSIPKEVPDWLCYPKV